MSNKRDLTRAEIVRNRRNERSAKEMKLTKQQALKPMVRATSRTPTVPINGYAPIKQKTKRRFNLLLGVPELHLPKTKIALPNFHLHPNWRWTSLIITFLLGVTLYLLFTLPYFYVPQAAIFGANRITPEEINTVSGVMGASIFTLQSDEIKNNILTNFPELVSAEVKIYLPNHVHITIAERTPIILLQQNQGYTWIDSNGIAFRPRGFAEGLILVNAIDTPPAGIVDENNLTPYLQKDLVDAITLLAPLVPAGSTLSFSLADGLYWQDPRGWTVAFGTSSHDMPLKMRIYQSLVDSLTASSRTPVYINVIHPDAPFYRMAEVVEE